MRSNFSKQKVISLITISLLFTLCLPFSSFAADKTVQDSSAQVVQSEKFDMNVIDINDLANKNHVDPDELRAAIEKANNSPVFSPFSAVKRNDGIEASSGIIDVPSDGLDVNKIDINGLSKEHHVNPDQLRSLLERVINSPVKKGVTPQSVITRYDQNSTAYVATGNKTASGVWPAVGMCAVHHYSNGTPYIPFGTIIYYDRYVTILGNSYSSFDVEDTGDPNFVQSTYWTDLFFGPASNWQAAINYGNQIVTYAYYG